MDEKTLARKIRIRRDDMQLTQTQMADALGVSPSAANQWETGRIAVQRKHFDGLAAFLQVDRRFFYEEDYWPPQGQPDTSPEKVTAVSTAGMTEEDVAWFRKMGATLKSLPASKRAKFRDAMERDAENFKDMLSDS